MQIYEKDFDEAIETVRRWIAESDTVVVLTGAGISTDSGIPDFRGPQGVWTKNPQAEKTATIDHYMGSSEVRRESWKRRAHSKYPEREPNAGHLALAELERRGNLDTLITQNVDGLHAKAGTSLERLVEIHGNVREVMCMDCGERAAMERALARVRDGDEDPACRSCGGILKAATISFGQGLVQEDLLRAERAAAPTVRLRWSGGGHRDAIATARAELGQAASAGQAIPRARLGRPVGPHPLLCRCC